MSAPFHAITCLVDECSDDCPVSAAETTPLPPVYDRWGISVYHSESLELLRSWPDACVDAIVCDPPYGLSDIEPDQVVAAMLAWAQGDRERVPDSKGFMGAAWDTFVPPPAIWDECYRVLKPGGHLAAFTAARNVDIAGLAIRMAGFRIRDDLGAWVYSQGMPKGQDISKAIDRASGAEREVVGFKASHRPNVIGQRPGNSMDGGAYTARVETRAATDGARAWQGWNTQLAPAHEPILLARKPVSERTVAANVLRHGPGALNVDACRVRMTDADADAINAKHAGMDVGAYQRPPGTALNLSTNPMPMQAAKAHDDGRFPSNLLFCHHPGCGPDEAPSPCVDDCHVRVLDEQSGVTKTGAAPFNRNTALGVINDDAWQPQHQTAQRHPGEGGASRFYPTFRYEAKAPKSERPMVDGEAWITVKPTGLMRWLIRLLVPPGGTVLDWCCGSGATGQAARAEGFKAVLIDRDPKAIKLTKARLDARPRTEAPTEPGTKPAPADDHVHDLLDLLGGDAS